MAFGFSSRIKGLNLSPLKLLGVRLLGNSVCERMNRTISTRLRADHWNNLSVVNLPDPEPIDIDTFFQKLEESATAEDTVSERIRW